MTGSEPETDSWQRNYRGALSDAFLDHDATGYLLPLWTERPVSAAQAETRSHTKMRVSPGAIARPAPRSP